MSFTAQRPAPALRPTSLVDDETVDVTIDKLLLAGPRGGINVDVTDVIVDGTTADTMIGAPSLTLSLLDRDLRALKSGVFGQKVDVQLDGVPFRVVNVRLVDTDLLDLTLEHKLVALLREHFAPLKVARSTSTRAQFVETMAREIAPAFGALSFISPELHVVQPVSSTTKTGRTLKSKALGSGSRVTHNVRGSGPGLTHLTIRTWDGGQATLGPLQLKNAAIVLEVCAQLKAPAKAVLAVMAACSVEPGAPYSNPPVATDHTSTGILQLLSTTAAGLGISPLDVAACVTAFLRRGFTGAGGAIALANTTNLDAGTIAYKVQGCAAQFAGRYGQAIPGAQTVIAAFTGAGGLGATLAAGGFGATLASAAVPIAQYEFTRGQSGQVEDSWTAMQRLAGEVNWRCFVAGRNSLYFVTDDDLIKGETKYRIDPETIGVQKVTFDAEVGGRTIVRRGRRQPKPSEAIIEVRIDRWDAPPGSVIELQDYGPGDGRWLVSDISRGLFDPVAQITLHKPQTALPEPAAAPAPSLASSGLGASIASPASTAAGLSSSNLVDRVYAASTQIDQRALPYGPGGHGNDWAGAAQATTLDCSSSTSLALHMGGMMDNYPGPIVSGDFSGWGQPGVGQQMTVWYKPGAGSNGHVFIEFYGRPAKRFDTVPGGGARLRFQAPSASEQYGYVPRRWPGY